MPTQNRVATIEQHLFRMCADLGLNPTVSAIRERARNLDADICNEGGWVRTPEALKIIGCSYETLKDHGDNGRVRRRVINPYSKRPTYEWRRDDLLNLDPSRPRRRRRSL